MTTFLNTAWQLANFISTHNLKIPVIRITFPDPVSAHAAWKAIERELNTYTLHPSDQTLAFGTFRSHGVDFIIEPLT